MSSAHHELPDEVRRLIEEPLVPFNQLDTYDMQEGVYEIDRRPQPGYDVVLLYKLGAIGTEVITRVEAEGKLVADVPTPSDQALDQLHHVFSKVSPEDTELVFPTSLAA